MDVVFKFVKLFSPENEYLGKGEIPDTSPSDFLFYDDELYRLREGTSDCYVLLESAGIPTVPILRND